MAKQPLGGRPNKATLVRIKLATMVVSIATFVSSLGVIVLFNPGIASTAGLSGASPSAVRWRRFTWWPRSLSCCWRCSASWLPGQAKVLPPGPGEPNNARPLEAGEGGVQAGRLRGPGPLGPRRQDPRLVSESESGR